MFFTTQKISKNSVRMPNPAIAIAENTKYKKQNKTYMRIGTPVHLPKAKTVIIMRL